MSFKEGAVPLGMKNAIVTPILKKSTLSCEELGNFRPVSNLSYISKIAEKVASIRIQHHMKQHDYHETYQSAYKQFHGTESALLMVFNDILMSLDKQECVLLILLDLSAAFDTIDHQVLLERLQEVLGLNGKALAWIKSYLSERTQVVTTGKAFSEILCLLFGVPQGSVLGPLLFIIYTSPLGKILEKHGARYHLYGDDTQIYFNFDPKNVTGNCQS